MFVPFDSLPPTSRVWIYQADRKISPEEKTIIENRLKLFTDGWAAHGVPLRSSFKIAYDQFVILSADEAFHAPSGCSIDSSVHAIQEIGGEINIDFFNRDLVALMKNEEIILVGLADLKSALKNGKWDDQFLTFNNLITNKSGLETDWVIPVSASWLKRYLTSDKVAH